MRTLALGLLSKYAIDKSRSVRASYQYSRLRSLSFIWRRPTVNGASFRRDACGP